MPAIRVYELAKEMDMNSKVLLDAMIELGLPMKNHMSTIPGNEVSRIRAMVMKHLGDPNAEPIPRPVEKKEKPPLDGLKKRPMTREQGRESGQFQNQNMNRGAGAYGQGGMNRSQGYGERQGGGGFGADRSGQNRPADARPGQGFRNPARPGQGRTGEARQNQFGAGQNRFSGQQGGAAGYRGAGEGRAADGRVTDERTNVLSGMNAGGVRRQPGDAIRPLEAQEQVRTRRQPGDAISPLEAQEQARIRRQPGDAISPREALERARLYAARQKPESQGEPAPDEGGGEGAILADAGADAAAALAGAALAQGAAADPHGGDGRGEAGVRAAAAAGSAVSATGTVAASATVQASATAETAGQGADGGTGAEAGRGQERTAGDGGRAPDAEADRAVQNKEIGGGGQGQDRQAAQGQGGQGQQGQGGFRQQGQPRPQGQGLGQGEQAAQGQSGQGQRNAQAQGGQGQGYPGGRPAAAGARGAQGQGGQQGQRSAQGQGGQGQQGQGGFQRQGQPRPQGQGGQGQGAHAAQGQGGQGQRNAQTQGGQGQGYPGGRPAAAGARGAQGQQGQGGFQRQGQPRPQGQGQGQGAQAMQGQGGQGQQRPQGQGGGNAPGGAGQAKGPGQNRMQTMADKFNRTPGQNKPPQKPRRPAAPVDNRQKGFNKGPKAPVIGRDTADQLTHLGSATEEDSRFLNKVENAVGEKAYDRGGIARTPSRKPGRFDESRFGRPKGRGGRDRGRQFRPEPAPVVIKNITLDGPTTVTDFAHLLGRKTGDIIKKLISYGIMANLNQELDLDTLILLGQEFGTQVEAKITKEDILIAADEPDLPETLKERPPVVTIMGHVDHGKTSLLDAIRQANVTASEAGGITQHIGAYQVEINGRRITFLDTPGHEAFTAMRARGAQCTDIAILVVAADDGVMPQTVEAVNHAKAAKVPIIVAVNKIDKEGANPERIKQELTEHGLVAEEWGGDTVFAEVSARTRQGLDQLLEMILLVADVADLKANPDRKAKGVVIEAKLDKGRGPVATVLVQNGTLESGDFLIAGTSKGRIRAMTDERGRLLKKAGPSAPVEVIGLSEVPQAGDSFQVVEDERLAKQIADERTAVRREEDRHSRSRISLEDVFAQIQTGEVKDLNIIIKADVQGSIEALKGSLEKLSNEEVRVQTIHTGVGGITEADVDFASASDAVILGFNVRPDANARRAAEGKQVDIRLYRVIYNAIEDVKSALSGMLKPEIRENVIGRAEVRQVIRVPKIGAIAGCYILEGKISRGCLVRVIRDNIVIHEGSLSSLRRFKDDVREVASGFECGIGIERFQDFQDGDHIEGFILEEIKRELA